MYSLPTVCFSIHGRAVACHEDVFVDPFMTHGEVVRHPNFCGSSFQACAISRSKEEALKGRVGIIECTPSVDKVNSCSQDGSFAHKICAFKTCVCQGVVDVEHDARVSDIW